MAEPTHRRGQVVLDQVLDATLSLLAEYGYAFSVDDVAEAADVHKTTIYRSDQPRRRRGQSAADRSR